MESKSKTRGNLPLCKTSRITSRLFTGDSLITCAFGIIFISSSASFGCTSTSLVDGGFITSSSFTFCCFVALLGKSSSSSPAVVVKGSRESSRLRARSMARCAGRLNVVGIKALTSTQRDLSLPFLRVNPRVFVCISRKVVLTILKSLLVLQKRRTKVKIKCQRNANECVLHCAALCMSSNAITHAFMKSIK